MRYIAPPAAKLPAVRSCAFIEEIVMTTTLPINQIVFFRHRPAPHRGAVA
jgi:hypothetical protein